MAAFAEFDVVTAWTPAPVVDMVTASTSRGCVVLPAASFRVTDIAATPDAAVDVDAGVSDKEVALPVVVKAKETVSTTPADALEFVVKLPT